MDGPRGKTNAFRRVAHSLIGSAGVHYVVSELSRRGMIALPTTRNTPAFDVLVSSADGKHHANIQVKTSLKARPPSFFPMPPSEKLRLRAGPNDYYVLLRWLSAEQKFEGFMLTGREACERVCHTEEIQRKRMGGRNPARKTLFPALYVSGEPRADKWRRRWREWSL